MTVGKSTKKVRKTTSLTKNVEYNSVNEMARDTGIVMKSLVNQDGRFTTKEASAISGLFNGHIHLVKIRLEAAKLHSATSDITTNDVLALR